VDTLRAFVGCLVDLGATRRLADTSRALRRVLDAAGWRASWAPPPNLHITLKFLGEIDVGTTPAVSDALAVVARRHAPLRLGLRDLVALPDREAPRVLAVGVSEGHEALAALARAVDDACFELGFPREKRPFLGHVTLARVRHQAGALAAVPFPRVDVGVGTAHDVALYRSDLARAGVEYHSLSRHPLGENRAAQNPTKQSESER
jgi:2'-5' RNA ligase